MCWIVLSVATTVTIYTWKNSEPIERIIDVITLIFMLGLTICVTYSSNVEIQRQGIDKYLNKEIVIDKIEITYDSQSNPIDTTYYYVKNRNKS